MLSTVSAPALLEALPEAVLVIDTEARIVFANARVEAMFGCARAELEGELVSVLLPEDNLRSSSPPLSRLVREHVTYRALSGESLLGRHKSGRSFPVAITLTTLALTSGCLVFVVVRDRSVQAADRAALQDALRTQTRLEGSTIGVMRIDDSGTVTHINDAWREFVNENCQYEPTCVGLGENYLQACESSDHAWAPKMVAGIRAVLAGDTDYFEMLYSCHSPTRLRWFRLQARRPADRGQAVVLAHIDSTEHQLAHARARIQASIADVFAERVSLLDSCLQLARVVCQELAWDHAQIWLPDEALAQLHCEALWTRPGLGFDSFENEVRQLRLAHGAGLPGRVWKSQKAEWVTDIGTAGSLNAAAAGLRPLAQAAGICSGFAFAVQYESVVLAVVGVFGRMRQSPDPELLALLEIAGVQLATAELRDRAERRAASAQVEAHAARDQLLAVLACVPALVIAIDRAGALRFVNRSLPLGTRLVSEHATWRDYLPEEAVPTIQRALDVVLSGGAPQTQDLTVRDAAGQETWFTLYLSPIRSEAEITGALIVSQDVTQMKLAQQELFNAQRLASVGTLAAGVAHEINTPVQFVGDSLGFLRDAADDMFALLQKLLALRDAAESGAPARDLQALVRETREAEDSADLRYLIEHVPQAFERCADGLGRVSNIVRSMREFSHPAQKHMAPVDLNRAITATLTVARTEYKYVAELTTEFSDLPPIMCHINDINQVVLNLVVNAAHAIADKNAGSERVGSIKVRTHVEGAQVVIEIEDDGGGIPEAIRARIFDPFFTTKEVGRGTGQGLSIARTAVTEKHGGELTFDTRLGVGTTFFVRLPIDGQRQRRLSA